jgi:hypothetical protein
LQPMHKSESSDQSDHRDRAMPRTLSGEISPRPR